MNKLELFEERNFKGTSISLTDDVADLSQRGFHNKASSLCITGDAWVFYTDKNYSGGFEVYKEGKYSSIPDLANKISSARIIKGGLYNPQITVYEHAGYQGKMATITEETRSVKNYDMENMISAHQVQSGCWVLYEQENYQGKRIIALAGDAVDNYFDIGWDNLVRSLKPATTCD